MTEGQTFARAIRRRITDFEAKSGPMALRFAYHAALPVALDADLLHLLRINFFLDPPASLSYTAEADLLLSPLCTEIRDGLYEIESSIRDHLLARLFATYGQDRIRDVATLLWQYTENYTPWETHPGLQRAQELTALNFLEPQQAQKWLNIAATSFVQQGPSLEHQWFIAMRQDLQKQQRIQEKQYVQNDTQPKKIIKSTTILIIDDNIRLAASLKQSIEANTKYIAVAVNTAQAALEAALHLHPCLLLLDSQLPESGLELYDRLQEYEEVRGVPTIMMGVTLPIDALNLRNIYHLRKPLDLEIVLTMITNVLAETAKKQSTIPLVDILSGVSPEYLEEMQGALLYKQDLHKLYETFLQYIEEITHSGHSQLFLLPKDAGGEEIFQLAAYFAGSAVIIIPADAPEDALAFADSLFTETFPHQSKLDTPLLNPKTGLPIGVVNIASEYPISPSVAAQVETLSLTCATVLLRIQEKQISRLLQDSYRLYTQRRFHDAQTLYEQLVRADRNNAQAWQGQGLTQAMNGQHQEALNSFNRALQLDPTLIPSLNGKGTALNTLHRNQEALEVFEQALKLDPENALSWNGQGEAFSALNQPDKALQAFDQALCLDPNMAQAQSNRDTLLLRLKPGDAYDQQQKYETADSDAYVLVEQMTTPGQREILAEYSKGFSPSQVAEELSMDVSSIFGYTSDLLRLCRHVWHLDPDIVLDYRFLQEKFADYVFKHKEANEEEEKAAVDNDSSSLRKGTLTANNYPTLVMEKEFLKDLEKLSSNTVKLVNSKIALLTKNSSHPSLLSHRISSKDNLWQCYINNIYRLMYKQEKGVIYLKRIVKHDNKSYSRV